ncbi:MAG: flavin reductase family protein [Cyanobacteria bacterium MAG CAR3_bin_5]|nr:flavin reductase family protein [Cyanobacteria bacterium MAG CAR3_bin_5]
MDLDVAAKTTLLKTIPHGLFICGVAEEEAVNGFTASWVTQGSFKPPLVVMGVRSDSTSHGMIQRTGRFSLNVMEVGQQEVVARFFRPQAAVGGRLAEVPYRLGVVLGLPLLEDCLGGLECELVGHVAAGDHAVFVGEVKAAVLHREGEALTMAHTRWTYGG